MKDCLSCINNCKGNISDTCPYSNKENIYACYTCIYCKYLQLSGGYVCTVDPDKVCDGGTLIPDNYIYFYKCRFYKMNKPYKKVLNE